MPAIAADRIGTDLLEPKPWTGLGLRLAAVAWLGGLLGGMTAFASYKGTPGPEGEPPLRWPTASSIALDAERPTLLMFAHPKCPCTRASLSELNLVLNKYAAQVAASVVFAEPVDDRSWRVGSAWDQARALPGARVLDDLGEVEAARFGAKVSGYVLLYSRAGELLYAGGVTGSRGHEGANLGRTRLETIIRGEAADRPNAPTFGCELSDP
jgi:hypothetical protein